MTMVRVRFTPQAWIDDYAVDVDAEGPTEFRVPVDDAKDDNGEWLKDHSYASDELKDHANAPQWIREWRGPFDIQILKGARR